MFEWNIVPELCHEQDFMYRLSDDNCTAEKVSHPDIITTVREKRGRELGRHMVWMRIDAIAETVDAMHDMLGICSSSFGEFALVSEQAVAVGLSGQVSVGGEVVAAEAAFPALQVGDVVCLLVDCRQRRLTIGVGERVESFGLCFEPPYFVSASFRDVGTKVSVTARWEGEGLAALIPAATSASASVSVSAASASAAAAASGPTSLEVGPLPLRCQCCNIKYQSSGPHRPLQLLCGHVICASDAEVLICASSKKGCDWWTEVSAVPKESRVIECLICQYRTPEDYFSNNQSFPSPHCGILRVLESTIFPQIEPVIELCDNCQNYPATKFCQKCEIPVCDACDEEIHSSKSLSKHIRVIIDDKPVTHFTCSDHEGEKLKVYCSTCGHLVCSICTSHGKHIGHDSKLIGDAGKDARETIAQLQQITDEKVNALMGVHKGLQTAEAALLENQEAFLLQLQSDFGLLHVALDRKEREVTAALRDHVRGRLRDVGGLMVACRDSAGELQGRQFEATGVLREDNSVFLQRYTAVLESMKIVKDKYILSLKDIPNTSLVYPIDSSMSTKITEEASASLSAEIVAMWAAEDEALSKKGGASVVKKRTPRPGRIQISKHTGTMLNHISELTFDVLKYKGKKARGHAFTEDNFLPLSDLFGE